jgi:hypothetical protein
MPTLKTQGGEAVTLTLDQECLLLHGRTFFGGWEKALEDAAWLHTPEARAAWRRHRARLIRDWLRTMPRELPAASRLYDTPQQRRELERMLRKAWAKYDRRRPLPPRAADTATRKADLVQ